MIPYVLIGDTTKIQNYIKEHKKDLQKQLKQLEKKYPKTFGRPMDVTRYMIELERLIEFYNYRVIVPAQLAGTDMVINVKILDQFNKTLRKHRKKWPVTIEIGQRIHIKYEKGELILCDMRDYFRQAEELLPVISFEGVNQYEEQTN